MRWLVFILLLAPLNAQPDFTTWWKQFQTAVSARNVSVVTRGVSFPMQWENGKLRNVKSAAELAAHFDTYFTPEIRAIIVKRTPVEEGRTSRTITWKARGNEYSLYFKASGDTWMLDGLSEGPP
jgi:hypothetical protein